MCNNTIFTKHIISTTGLILILIAGIPSAKGLPTSAPDNYRFSKAEVVDRVILSVIEDYYDPERIDSSRMFKAIMNIFQKAIAELKVRYDDNKNTATVELNSHTHVLDLSSLTSPWRLSRELRNLFKIMEKELPKNEYDFMELEYAAANAMLSTLDPHSNALPPEVFDYLRMDTAGEFGGLGIKITTDRRPPCKGNLTVVEVFDDTPAKRSGLKVGDQIIRIAGESTVNITTSEAADRLRGLPGTKVKVQVKRLNGTIHNFNIEREMIPIKSVEHEMLEGNVGYINLRAFQENSEEEMLYALKKLHSKGTSIGIGNEKRMKGLILDLRGNPGGLLHIAIQIVDHFLPAGTIVTTAGRSEEERSIENAHAENTEPMYPLVILIDSTSASAAEIMAGALRNHGRALLVGETTFGKGSVQMVRRIQGGGGLKLTSSQYLTPGDISIQAVGVTPDITFNPVSVDKDDMDIVPGETRFSEADLDHHLDRPNVRTRSDRTLTESAALYIPKAELESDKARFRRCFVDEEIDRPFKGRYEKEFARRLIVKSKGASSDELFALARTLIESDNKKQEGLIVKALQKLNVDWSTAKNSAKKEKAENTPQKNAKISASVRVVGNVAPGKKFKLKATVQNNTKQPIYRLRGVTKSDNYLLNEREFIFGKLLPGQKRTWTEEISLPITAHARVDDVEVNYESETGPAPKSSRVEVSVPERPGPRLTYGWHFQDLGNGNGIFEPGEEVLMYVTVKNVGKGATANAEVGLSAKPGIDLIHGQFDIGNLAPDQTAQGVLRLRIADPYLLNDAKLNLSIQEWIETEAGYQSTRSLMDREITMNITVAGGKVSPVSGTITVNGTGDVALVESPSSESHQVASAKSGAVFTVSGIFANYYRVILDKSRHVWLAKKSATSGGKLKPDFTPTLIHLPKIIVKGALVRRVKKDKMTIEGHAEHPIGVRDVMIFRGDQKILYQPTVKSTNSKHINFSAEIPLEAGDNNIIIVARHDDKVVGSKSLFVRLDSKKKKKEKK